MTVERRPSVARFGRWAWRAVDANQGRLVVVVVVVVLAPLVVTGLAALIHGGANPGGDPGLIELRVRDVGSAGTPLLGSYGRYGFNQPGPLWFYLLAVPYRLLGSRYVGLQIGVLLLGAASITQIAAVAWRRGSSFLLLWSAVLVGVLVHGLGPGWLADPWEPHALTLACGALVFVAFDAVAGRAGALPVAAVLATLLSQAQAGLLGFAAAMFGIAAVAVTARCLRARNQAGATSARAVRAAALSAALLAVLWAPPLLDQFRHDPGNMVATWRSLRSPHQSLGLGRAAQAVALQFGHRAPWLGFRVPLEPFQPVVDVSKAPVVPIGFVALVGGLFVPARRRDNPLWLLLVVVAASAAAIASLARLIGPLFVWILEWTRVVGLAAWIAIGWAAYRAVSVGARRRVDRVVLPTLMVVAVGLSAASVVEAAGYHRSDDPLEVALRQLAADAVPTVRAVRGPVLVRSEAKASLVFGGSRVGLQELVLALDRARVDVVVDHDVADRFGLERARPERATAELLLVNDEPGVRAGYRVVARVDPATPAQHAERARIIARIPALAPPRSLFEVQAALAADPTLRPLVDEFDKLPDLPRLALLMRMPP